MKITSLAKYIDQPLVRAHLHEKMPAAFVGSAALFGVYEAINSKNNKHHPRHQSILLNKMIVLASVVGFTLLGARGLKIAGKQILKPNLPYISVESVKNAQKQAVEEFVKGKNISDAKLLEILEKAKNSHLFVKDIEYLNKNLKDREFSSKITGKNEDITSKEILGEIGRISLLGAYSVLGGITGGIAADKITDTKRRKRTLDKVKEGFYQFFANIFLCNVGAAGALFLLEKSGKKVSPLKKMGAIVTGILITGILGGSLIANYLSEKILDPLFGIKKRGKSFYERKPELLDAALHIDDIATAGVLSGVGWIGPMLPLLFAISGYRAGTGYRNHHKFHISCLYAQRRAAKQFRFD